MPTITLDVLVLMFAFVLLSLVSAFIFASTFGKKECTTNNEIVERIFSGGVLLLMAALAFIPVKTETKSLETSLKKLRLERLYSKDTVLGTVVDTTLGLPASLTDICTVRIGDDSQHLHFVNLESDYITLPIKKGQQIQLVAVNKITGSASNVTDAYVLKSKLVELGIDPIKRNWQLRSRFSR